MFLTTADAAPRSVMDSPPLPVGACFAAREAAWEVVPAAGFAGDGAGRADRDRKSTRLNSSHPSISYAVFCLKKKKKKKKKTTNKKNKKKQKAQTNKKKE